ncbi:MAG: CDP-alcohol phosphatidyltransferase family protein [Actinomycetota bacterium]|nr:CDP-alcohol phosphatidyltransferase family protein [Actinomycetota bacterium]
MTRPPVPASASAAAPDIWNIPNALSVLRLLLVPVFLWLILVLHADGAAAIVLAVSGFTDYLDGKLARAWGQISRFGQLLDPIADRLYVLTAVAALTIRDVVPLELTLVLLARDVALTALIPLLRRRGYGPLQVHYLGKTATFALLASFPLVLLGAGSGLVADLARPVGWAFMFWGVGLYLWAAVLYAVQVRQLLSEPLVEPR